MCQFVVMFMFCDVFCLIMFFFVVVCYWNEVYNDGE